MSEGQKLPIPLSRKSFRQIYVPFVDPTEARCANIEGVVNVRPPACRAGANCRTAKPGRNRDGASRGNCTRHSVFGTHCPQCGYALSPGDAQEMCRDDQALRELLAIWPRLTPSVRTIIMDLARSAIRDPLAVYRHDLIASRHGIGENHPGFG
jgi:hypothetical protein